MGVKNQIDKTRMMGTAAFKKEINHLLYSNSYTGSDGEFDAGWNCRDHSLVMALMLKSGDTWLLHSKFGVIDVSPDLLSKGHRFRDPFNGIFNRVWLPQGIERVSVVLCNDPGQYEKLIEKARRSMSHSTAVYLHLDDQEVTEKLIKSPFKFLNSRFSTEIKQRFGSDFYPAVAKHLHNYVLGKSNSLISVARLKAWGTVVDEFSR